MSCQDLLLPRIDRRYVHMCMYVSHGFLYTPVDCALHLFPVKHSGYALSSSLCSLSHAILNWHTSGDSHLLDLLCI